MTTNNHPAHGPVSLDRLHQISEILSKAAAQSDGGNLGYAMADAVKVIDGAIAARKAGQEPVAWVRYCSDGTIDGPLLNYQIDDCRKSTWTPLYAAPQLPLPELTVFYKSMPESNGKENWTAILHRKGEGIQDGITIDRSEYPGRVLYAADRVRYLIGEKPDRPYILDYDGDKHSGYVWPRTKESAAVETLEGEGYTWNGGQLWKPPIGKAPAYITGEHPAVPEEATPDDIEILASIRPPHGVAYEWDEDQRNSAADAWNACRGAMLQGAEPVSQPYTLPEWLQQAHKLAELHGISFVVFRHGEEAQCADPTKVIISFTDESLGHHSTAPQQEDVK